MSSIKRINIINVLNEAAWSENPVEVIDLLNSMFGNDEYKEYLDLIYFAISSFQLYGFLAYLTDEEREDFLDVDLYRTNSYKGNELEYYNRGQFSLICELERNKKVLFSAPTSFGKTSIIIEYILQNKRNLKNIVFIVPTNSLLEEIYLKFLKYNKKYEMGFNIITQPGRLVGNNILMFTPERFLIFLQMAELKQIDLIVMDELYKIADSDKGKVKNVVNDRSLRFRKVADIIAASENQVIFLSPFTYTLSESMSRFVKKYNIKKVDRRVEYVKKEILKVSDIVSVSKSKNCEKVNAALEVLKGERNIVYVNGYSEGYKIVNFYSVEPMTKDSKRYLAFCRHIENNYEIEECSWTIADAIKKGIGLYVSNMPRYIKKELVLLFEDDVIKTMIVTTAFTEGVNTSAKNLIFTSVKTGGNTKDLSDIDVLNVVGRVGRFAKESIGKVYCLTDSIYEKVRQLQENGDCVLVNDNYVEDKPKNDYEIEMMDDEYLSTQEKSRKLKLKEDIKSIGLSEKDLYISLNVSNMWKYRLYMFFRTLGAEEIQKRYDFLQIVLKQKDGDVEEALNVLFKDIKSAIEKEGEKVFHTRSNEMPAFDSRGEFVWGRWYKYYANDDVKGSIRRDIKYITGQYSKVLGSRRFANKKSAKAWFALNGYEWILDYYTKDLEVDYNKFYMKYFSFISSIVQYKLPFYLSFYMSMFKLFVQKENLAEYDVKEFKEKDIQILFEDGGLSNEYKELLDFGIPMITLNKIKTREITMEELKENYTTMSELDEYEKLIIGDYFRLK